ncbi:hypothetical protein IP87_12475 [beta proteobacterium AAP121]|nr:hypothetical protein IP80_20350 [beta proteobacterium AAP65]KPF97188.1 hypothetical protein IP87_12475 [beta proteobacterium AAP121]
MRILVTGASGFVGSGFMRLIAQCPEIQGVAAFRRLPRIAPAGYDMVQLDFDGSAPHAESALAGIDTIVHLAARVHVMRDTEADPLAAFRRVNTQGTLALAEAALRAGVKRLVYVSSIKVNGEGTAPGRRYLANDAPDPHDPYGQSKAEAEGLLWQVAERSALQVVVVRPPLVYGPGVKANFRSMMGWLHRGIPLPLGAIDNRRSLVSQDNLCSLLLACAQHPDAPGHTFLASDGEDVSTTELLRRLGLALGRPARLLPVPPGVLRLALGALGKSSIAHRLLGSLQVDSSSARTVLGWQPPLTLDQGLQRAAASFLAEKQAA